MCFMLCISLCTVAVMVNELLRVSAMLVCETGGELVCGGGRSSDASDASDASDVSYASVRGPHGAFPAVCGSVSLPERQDGGCGGRRVWMMEWRGESRWEMRAAREERETEKVNESVGVIVPAPMGEVVGVWVLVLWVIVPVSSTRPVHGWLWIRSCVGWFVPDSGLLFNKCWSRAQI